MKRLAKAASFALLVLLPIAPAVAAPAEEPVAVVVEGVSPEVARAIKRQAAQGKTALLKYLERGRFVYAVRIEPAREDKTALSSATRTYPK